MDGGVADLWRLEDARGGRPHPPDATDLLDEPSDHLDIATKQMRIEALSCCEGAMLFVSHDWHFLAALPSRVLS